MTFAELGYGAAAMAYALLALLLFAGQAPGKRDYVVIAAIGGTAIWGGTIVTVLLIGAGESSLILIVADAFRALLWTFCLLTVLPGRMVGTVKGVLAVAAVLFAGLAIGMPPGLERAEYPALAQLGLTVVTCSTVEQVLRNCAAEQRRTLEPFLWPLAAVLVYDLFVLSHAALFGEVGDALWAARGLLAAIVMPLLVIAAKRHPDWQKTLFISRDVVFYSATLTAFGLYLIAISIGVVVIREQQGEWGPAMELAFFFAALGVLIYIVSFARLRRRLRVFISKHFYRNRYDYRDEWLRLTRTLSSDELPLDQRSIKALCAVVESDGGQLWLDRGSRGVYEPFGVWQAPFVSREFASQSALVRFLNEHRWVIDTRQYQRDPEHYWHAFRGAADELPQDSLIVPLFHRNEMLGIARLNRNPNLAELNYEDHDLLKTVGRQVAAFLAHDLAKEELAETRQFEAYNKLAAFVMHDLKNLLSQQALLVGNAKKFRDRPDFVTDVISTVDNGVQRMRRLLRQLEQGAPVAFDQRVEVNKLILRVISSCADDAKGLCSFSEQSPAVFVKANPDQLSSVIAHVLQNAREATPDGGTVAVSLAEAPGDRVAIEIRDNGAGMSEEFIRRKLFKPFETTKGSAGMGIGAYQAREVVRGLGGELSVDSQVGRGTTVRIILPRMPR